MYQSLMGIYQTNIKSVNLVHQLEDDGEIKVMNRLELIKEKIEVYKPNNQKSWLENNEYLEQLVYAIAWLVNNIRNECVGMGSCLFAKRMETKLHDFVDQKLGHAYLVDMIDAELTRGKDVKYYSPTIPPALDELSALIDGIKTETQRYLQRKQEMIEAFSYED